MKENFVPYEIASKLKELGFDEQCFTIYNQEGILYSWWVDSVPLSNGDLIRSVHSKDWVAAPTWDQVQEWLLVRRVLVEAKPIDSWDSWSYSIALENIMSPFFMLPGFGREFSNKKDALEAGILEALDHLNQLQPKSNENQGNT